MSHHEKQKRSFSKEQVKGAMMVAGGYMLFSAAVWSVFTNPRRHEWRSQYSGVWARIARRH
uniref:Uncharacterized protein n=1 Tax=Babesia bovis TaxID=5865 RepID=A7AW25_BABBO|eukprot:XP_001608821.1 hypothetical protein [Babesia bovis T2Bo]